MSDSRYNRSHYRPEYNREHRDRDYRREDDRHYRPRHSRSRSRSLDRYRTGNGNRYDGWNEAYNSASRADERWGGRNHYHHFDERDDDNNKRRKMRHERAPEGNWREQRPLGEPNNHVILQGLQMHTTEHSIQQSLENLQASIESIRLIRDRKTGLSRRFAFVKFTSVEHARQFVEANHPYIMVDGMRVRIDYSTSSSAEDEGWACKNCGFLNYKKRDNCHQCSHSKKESMVAGSLHLAPASAFFNDGTNDIGQAPCHMLLVRGLDPLTTEESLHAAASLLGALRRALLIKDRASRMSWGFAFLDYQDVQTSSSVLSVVNSPQCYPDGFIVDSRAVSMTYAQQGSFIPAYATTEWTIRGDEGIALSYWDEKAYAVEYAGVQETVEIGPQVPSAEISKTVADMISVTPNKGQPDQPEAKKDVSESNRSVEDELSAFYSDVGTALSSKGKGKSKSIFSVSGMVSGAAGPANGLDSADAELSAFYADLQSSEDRDKDVTKVTIGPEAPAPQPATPEKPARLPNTHDAPQEQSALLQLPNQELDFVASHHENPPHEPTLDRPVSQQSSVADTSGGPPSPAHETQEDPSAEVAEAADLDKAAPIAMPQDATKGVKEKKKKPQKPIVNRKVHEQLQKWNERKEELHSEDMDPLELEKLQPTYNNRAAKRRKIYGQPRRPGFPPNSSADQDESHYDQPTRYGIGEENVGNRMLQNMGWKAGEGLGKNRDGIVNPIQAEVYSERAGLGASTSISTDGPTSYYGMTKKLARARLEESS